MLNKIRLATLKVVLTPYSPYSKVLTELKYRNNNENKKSGSNLFMPHIIERKKMIKHFNSLA
jgi:hypothetical protein